VEGAAADLEAGELAEDCGVEHDEQVAVQVHLITTGQMDCGWLK
jgi:hypothetical protein